MYACLYHSHDIAGRSRDTKTCNSQSRDRVQSCGFNRTGSVGGSFTVKMYESSYDVVDGERRGRVELVPVSSDASFERLVFEDEELEGLEIVAEYVATVG